MFTCGVYMGNKIRPLCKCFIGSTHFERGTREINKILFIRSTGKVDTFLHAAFPKQLKEFVVDVVYSAGKNIAISNFHCI